MPGKKYHSIKAPDIYEALRREGKTKESEQDGHGRKQSVQNARSSHAAATKYPRMMKITACRNFIGVRARAAISSG